MPIIIIISITEAHFSLFTKIPADSNGIQKTICINDLNITALTPMSFISKGKIESMAFEKIKMI